MTEFPGAPQPTEAMFSLIVPVYNAGCFISQTWLAVQQFIAEAPGNWEALFVCDGCTDDSVIQLRDLPADDNMRVISYPVNRGKGHAVRRGMGAARGRWRIFMDCDLAYGFDDVLRVADFLRTGADVVIASRFHPDSRFVVPTGLHSYAWRRNLQSRLFGRLVRSLLHVNQRDTQAGLKGLSAKAVRRVWPHLQSTGFAFDCELLVACERLAIPVLEVPVTMYYDQPHSTTSFRTLRHMLRELWGIRRRWLGKQSSALPERAGEPVREPSF